MRLLKPWLLEAFEQKMLNDYKRIIALSNQSMLKGVTITLGKATESCKQKIAPDS